jgi:hypothetical protein
MLTAILFFPGPSTVFITILLSQVDASEFQDLGKIMLGGFVLAVGAGVTFTLIRLRLRDKKSPRPQFISINPREEKEK